MPNQRRLELHAPLALYTYFLILIRIIFIIILIISSENVNSFLSFILAHF